VSAAPVILCLRSRPAALALACVAIVALSGCGTRDTAGAHGASDAMGGERLQPLDVYVAPDAQFAIHLQLDELTKLPLIEELSRDKYGLGAFESIDTLDKACGAGWWEGFDELVVSGDPEKRDVLLVGRAKSPEEILGCFNKAFSGGKPARDFGGSGVRFADGTVALSRGQLVFAGAEPRVRKAIAGPEKRVALGDVRGQLPGSADSLARVFVQVTDDDMVRNVALAIDADEDHVSAAILVQSHSTEQADQLNALLRFAVERGLDNALSAPRETRVLLKRMLSSVDVRRRVEQRVSVELSVVGSARKQAEDLSTMAGFAQGFVRGFRNQRRVIEAKLRLRELAERVAAYADGHRQGVLKVPSFPESAPATPGLIPAGEAVKVSRDDWSHASWRALAYAPEGETYFNFAIVVAPTKRETIVRAIGDVDGDGKPTTLEIKVRISPTGQVTIDGEVSESE
jgi:hypothetical protein